MGGLWVGSGEWGVGRGGEGRFVLYARDRGGVFFLKRIYLIRNYKSCLFFSLPLHFS